MTDEERTVVMRVMYWASIAGVIVVLLTTGIVGGVPVIVIQ